jgi:hypothetical protein
MKLVSDPDLRAASHTRSPFDELSRGAPPVVYQEPRLPTPRPARARIAVYTTLAVAALALGLRMVAALLATPLERMPGTLAPTWLVELTTTSASPTTALLYGPDVGIQLVRVPAEGGTTADAGVVPARLARGEVHFVSLGLERLHIHAHAPQRAQPATFDADGRIITAYQTPRAVGVRTGW